MGTARRKAKLAAAVSTSQTTTRHAVQLDGNDSAEVQHKCAKGGVEKKEPGADAERGRRGQPVGMIQSALVIQPIHADCAPTIGDLCVAGSVFAGWRSSGRIR